MEKVKLSKEELDKLSKIDTENKNITFSLGQVEVNKALLEGQKSSLLEQLATLQKESNEIAKELQEKYGAGNIDLSSGEFTKAE
jgi:predicted nuclease with TOPRIM domain